METTRIHAIEGAMIASLDGLDRLCSIVALHDNPCQVVVVSPLRRGELSFHDLLSSAARKDEKLWSMLEKSESTWQSFVCQAGAADRMEDMLRGDFEDMEDLLRSVWLLCDVSRNTENYFSCLTSRFLSHLASCYLERRGMTATVMDVETALRTRSFVKGVTIVHGQLRQNSSHAYQGEGESEYSASLIAASCDGELTFWNSRSLFCSASSRDIPSARVIERLTYAEATELSFFGAPIVHPHAFIPAQSRGIEIELRYWGDYTNSGTLITGMTSARDRRCPVKAFSVMRSIAIINVEGAGMSGVIGISSRLFSALREEGISVILISQASSEYSICFAVPASQMTQAASCARYEFKSELDSHQIASISAVGGMAIIAAVGEMMSGQVGVSGKFFSALARAGVNVSAIAQGSSERNISAVIREEDSHKALSALHSSFFLSAQTLSVGLFGPGNIGGTLLDQLAQEQERLRGQFELDIRVRGIANSTKMLLSEEGVDLSSWRDTFQLAAVPLDMDVFLRHVGASYYPHAVLIDCTTSNALAMQYASWLRHFHVITPNKKACTASYEYYQKMMQTSQESGRRFLYETTVGAGLPIINTLNDLIQTGDEVKRIEGIVSGTLAWLFAHYDGTTPFSQLVLDAKGMGYTEPDPRDDLSGMDVARKTVILAREIGSRVELGDFAVQSLVPESLRNVSKEEFLSRIGEIDEDMKRRYDEAKREGKVLRYIGCVENGRCSVSLSALPMSHPFAQAGGSDNIIAFTTARYFQQPLVIKGPGAGPQVTAGGVFSDLIRLSVYLGAGLI